MSREAHVWGQSPAADAVRELVVGLAPGVAGKRLLVALQAYIDESVGGAGDFVLAGHIATADSWEEFSREWDDLLQSGFGLLDDKGRHFHMAEMAWLPERMERVAPFYRVIENHVQMSISVHFKIADLERALKRVYVPRWRPDWKQWGNPHFFAFRVLLDGFHNKKQLWEDEFPVDQPVDFIFDDHSSKRPLLKSWDRYIEQRRTHVRDRYGETPIFRNDRKFLPLQAADLWAWWMREWYEKGGSIREHMQQLNFGKWEAHKERRLTAFDVDEDQIVDALLNVAAGNAPQDWWVFDLRPATGVLYGRRGFSFAPPDLRPFNRRSSESDGAQQT